jgi:hypothetical protein
MQDVQMEFGFGFEGTDKENEPERLIFFNKILKLN